MKKIHAQELISHFDKAALSDICENLGENYDEILAFATGRRVQMRDSRSGAWQNTGDNPRLGDDSVEFRVHPDDAHVAFYYVDSEGCVAAKVGEVAHDDRHKRAGNHFETFEEAHKVAKEVKKAWKCRRAFDVDKMLEVFGLRKDL
ncbi:MAG: hypothetical protein IKW49_08730 [Opitutales bacterium]|nr:hypothetical protein [Opitutales bacterium]